MQDEMEMGVMMDSNCEDASCGGDGDEMEMMVVMRVTRCSRCNK